MKLALGFSAGLVVGSAAATYFVSHWHGASSDITPHSAANTAAVEPQSCIQPPDQPPDEMVHVRSSSGSYNATDTMSDEDRGWRWSPPGACGAGTEAQGRVVQAFDSSAR
jgi:hypothetical protein